MTFSTRVLHTFSTRLVLFMAMSATGLHAQVRDTIDLRRPCTVPMYKDPAAATMLSWVSPGAGQFYTGRLWEGIGIFAATAGGVYYATSSPRRGYVSTDERTNRQAVGISVAAFSWLLGVVTAAHGAHEHNRGVREAVTRGSYGPMPCPRWP